MKTITRSRLSQAMTWLFLTTSFILLAIFNATKPRIVIVHSLSQASSWTSSVDQGIKAALKDNRAPVSVTSEYLNLDLLSVNADLEALASGMRRRIDAIDPDVLIVVDDETSELIGRHYVGRSKTSVIYTSLLADPGAYGYRDPSKVIGVREILPLSAITEVISHVHPGRSARIAVVGAATQTGLAEMQQVRAHDWGPHQMIASQSVPHFEAWMDFVNGPARQADVLIALTMDNLAISATQPRSAPEEQIARWTETKAKPLTIGVRASYVQYGGSLAVSAPPVEYGRSAVELALKRVANPNFTPNGSSITLDSYDMSLRLSAIERRGMTLPAIYREAARASGHLYR
jgi:hypothetical protein